MIFYLIAYDVEGKPEAILTLNEQTSTKTALGRGKYVADVIEVDSPDPAYPDLSLVQVGDLVRLSIEIEKIPPYQGLPPAPERNPNVQTTVAELLTATTVRLVVAQVLAPEIFTRYRMDRTQSHSDFDPAAEAAFRAAHPTCSFLKAKLVWFLSQKHLSVVAGKIIDVRDGQEPYGIVYL